jgi:thiosulfate/3-mercaptopyruvate sulfurtransferase
VSLVRAAGAGRSGRNQRIPPCNPLDHTCKVSLIGAVALAERLRTRGDTRVADVRWYLNRPGAGRAAYDDGHIPGALFLDLDADLSDPEGLGAPGRHPLPSPRTVAQTLGRIGIGSEHFVVAYDDAGGTVAARLWWMLDRLGHRGGVAMLDGGIGAWLEAGLPLDTQTPSYPPAELLLNEEWTGVIERGDLAARLGEIALLDARAPERYRGEVEPIDPAAGHIPTALNVPVSGNLKPDGLLLSPAQLRDRFTQQVGQGLDDAVLYCGSGTNACHHALAMRLAGLPDPTLYVGSFSDWSRSGMPVVAGSEPGGRQ